MEEIGKSALIAIVGMMASAAIVAGGVVLRPDGLAPRQVAAPAPPPSKPAVPPGGFARGPLQPSLAFDLPAALPVPPGPARAVPVNPAGAGVEPKMAEAQLPSLKGSARPQSPEAKPPPPLSTFRRGPDQPSLGLNLPIAQPGISAPARAGVGGLTDSAPVPRAESARLPSLEGSLRPQSPERKPPPPLSAFRRGPEQPLLAFNLPETPPGLVPPENDAGIRADAVSPPRLAEARLPALDGSARPPSPDDKPESPQAQAQAQAVTAAGKSSKVLVTTLSPPSEPVAADRAASPPSHLDVPAWRRYAALAPADTGAPMIAIIIDDVGLNTQRMAQAIALPHPLTLAILPYAEHIAPWAAKVRAAGHELMLHLPMEPTDPEEDPGPNALLADLDPAEIARRIDWNLARFDGYVGVNNHMGSRFTASTVLMRPLMHRLAQRGLLFIDSLTTSASVGEELARAEGVPTAARDVFLDNDIEVSRIRAQLAKVEHCAARKGYCIAIGHPHPETLSVLAKWLPGLAARGFVLVPVSAIVARHMTG
jgi:uncharacterized protein